MQTNLLDEFGPDLRRIGMRLWKRSRPHHDHRADGSERD
jgi:hypothetical protein